MKHVLACDITHHIITTILRHGLKGRKLWKVFGCNLEHVCQNFAAAELVPYQEIALCHTLCTQVHLLCLKGQNGDLAIIRTQV